jgi:hypothetical protein
MHLHVAKTFETTKFIVEIYSDDHDINIDKILKPFMDIVNIQEYPRGIIETLLPLTGVHMIRVFDKNNILILAASDVLPEEIDYED